MKRRIGPARTPERRDGLTRPRAEERFRTLMTTEAAPRPADAERVTFEVAGEALKASLKIKQRKKSHQLTVASDLRNHIVPFFGAKRLDQIKPEDIERYVVVKEADGLAIKTIRNHINTMHSVLDIGVRRGWCPTNPVKVADRRRSSATRHACASSTSRRSSSSSRARSLPMPSAPSSRPST